MKVWKKQVFFTLIPVAILLLLVFKVLFEPSFFVHRNNESRAIEWSQRSVLFIKTHKTGSSTITGIIWRQLCLRQQLNCFLPPISNPGRTWDLTRAEDTLYIKNTLGTQMKPGPFQAWIHHVRNSYGRYEILADNPKIVLSSVRHPALRFRSAWSWYTLGHELGVDLRSFVRSLCINSTHSAQSLGFQRNCSLAHSESFQNIGQKRWLDATSQELVSLPLDHPDFSHRFNDLITQIEEIKIFLVVCDRFDESMLIMRWLLRDSQSVASTTFSIDELHFQDIWYLPQKVRFDPTEKLTLEEKHKLVLLQPNDMRLYQTANKALDKLIDKYDRNKFNKLLEAYRTSLKEVQSRCNNHPNGNADVDNSHIQDVDCEQLSMDNDVAIQTYWKSIPASNVKFFLYQYPLYFFWRFVKLTSTTKLLT